MIEPLEERRLLTAVVGNQILVSQEAGALVYPGLEPEVAMDSAGNFVVTWQGRNAQTNEWDIYARRYAASGAPLGDAFRVNTYVPGYQMQPRIAMSATGSFIITWQSAGQDGDGWGVYSQLYGQDGNAIGGETQVNTTTAGSQQNPAVAMNDAGAFVIAWTNGVNSQLRLFDAAGSARGGEILAQTDDGFRPAVAMDGDGNFIHSVIDNSRISTQRFTAGGSKVGQALVISMDAATVQVTMNSRGEFVVAGSRITQLLAQRYSREGIALGEPIEVRPQITEYISPTPSTDFGMTMDDAGNLTFATMGALPPYTNPGLYVLRYDVSGDLEHENIVLLEDWVLGRHISAATTRVGQIVVAWNNAFAQVSSVAAQRLEVPLLRVTGVATLAEEQLRRDARPLTPVDGFYVHFSRPIDPTSVTNPANWQLLFGGIDISPRISEITYADQRARITLAAPLGTGKYSLVARAVHDPDGQLLDGDSDQMPGGDFVFNFAVDAVYPIGRQILLNPPTTPPPPAFTPSHFLDKNVQIASNAAGQMVAVWSRLGTSSTIAQRLDAAGQPLGPQIVVQSAAVGTVTAPPTVGMDAEGNFVVAWQSSAGVISLRRYWADGTPRGEISSIATSAAGVLAVHPSGRYAFAYGSSLQFFEADGSPLSGVLQLAATAQTPALAFTNTGELIVAWQGADTRIMARRFTLQGAPLGSEFLVGTLMPFISASAAEVSVAASPFGGFAVAWQRKGGPQEGSSGTLSPDSHVFARLYGPGAQPLTEAFQVNTDFLSRSMTTPPKLAPPRVAFDPMGRFLITWQSIAVDYEGLGIFGRGYLPNGTPATEPFRVNTIWYNSQLAPSIIARPNGDFLVAWSEPGIQAQWLRMEHPLVLDLNGDSTGTGYRVDYTPGLGPVAIVDAQHLRISSPTQPELISATVRIQNAKPGDQLLVDTLGSGLSAVYAGGVLTLSGRASVESYERVLRTVRYNTSENYALGTKLTVSFSVTDGFLDSTTAESVITIGGLGTNSISSRRIPTYVGSGNFEKSAYLRGTGAATFANVTGNSRGLIGFRVDFRQTVNGLTADDFIFRIGANNSPETWATAPAPIFIDNRGGISQVAVYWQDNTIQNTWLEVTVKATPRTRLAAPEVFYFGSLIGDTGAGNTSTMAIVNATDQLAIRSRIGTFPGVPTYDLNRDGVINSTDELIARNHPGILRYLNLPIAAPATAQPAMLASASANPPELAAIAFALAGAEEGDPDPQTAGVPSTAATPLTDRPSLPAAAVAAVFSQGREGAANASRPPQGDEPQDAGIHAALGDVLADCWEGR